MRKEYGKFKIAIYGNSKEIADTEKILNTLRLTGEEYHDRLKIQRAIDEHKIKADILYDGNNIWSFDRVIRDFKRALNSKPSKMSEYGNGEWDMTDYLYKFLSLECGSIAHFNKYGWIGSYPAKKDLKQFCLKNEFGQDILTHQPIWASDRQRIAREMLKFCNQGEIDKQTQDNIKDRIALLNESIKRAEQDKGYAKELLNTLQIRY